MTAAEMAIAFRERYNKSIKQNEETKQYPLQVVAVHRKKLAVASRTVMMK